MPPIRASVAIDGDDVYEDLFSAAAVLPQILAEADIVASRRTRVEDANVVVLYTATGSTARLAPIERAVSAGTGLLAIHSTAVLDGALELLGARYLGHGPAPHETRHRVHTTGAVVTRGVPSFEIDHEHYLLAVAEDAQIEAWRETAEGREPVVLRRQFGSGRVCYLQIGHDMRVWAEPSIRALVRNAAVWAAAGTGSEV